MLKEKEVNEIQINYSNEIGYMNLSPEYEKELKKQITEEVNTLKDYLFKLEQKGEISLLETKDTIHVYADPDKVFFTLNRIKIKAYKLENKILAAMGEYINPLKRDYA